MIYICFIRDGDDAMTDRKALAKSLDRAAANCLSYPASAKQC